MIRWHFLDVHANFGHDQNIEIYSLFMQSFKAFAFLEKLACMTPCKVVQSGVASSYSLEALSYTSVTSHDTRMVVIQ